MSDKTIKKHYNQALDKLDLSDSERDAFDHDVKRLSLIHI